MRSSVTRKCRRTAIACAAALFVGVASLGSPVGAADGGRYASPSEAFRAGITAWQAGRIDEALSALEQAARGGNVGAQLRLAQIHASGDGGVEKSAAKSFLYYQKIAEQFAGASPRHPVADYIAEAFVALASHYRQGVAELNISPDATRAVALYRHAASYFGSVEAQYNLAGMYLAGEGVNKNVRLAVNWLTNAARKHHAPSQALLGELFWRGDGEFYHKPLKGLALIALARRNAIGTANEAWIEELYLRVSGAAKAEQRERAGELASRWQGGAGEEAKLDGDRPVIVLKKTVTPASQPTENVAAAEVVSPDIREVGAVESVAQPR